MKRSSVPGKVPNTAQLSIGELAVNLADNKLYSSNGTSVFQIGVTPSDISPGYYGSFYDTTATQVAVSNTSIQAVNINTTLSSNGVTLQNGNEIHFQYSGTYNVQFSIQFINTDNSIHNINVWFRKNGVNLPYSSGQSTVPNRHGGENGQIITAWNIVDTFAAGDYIQIVWQTDDVQAFIETIPASTTTPVHPVAPGIIITVTPVSNILSTSALAQSGSPANNATGTAGQIVFDSNYIYVCTSTNTWKRATLDVY
jgi:hypothetical protein